MSIFMEKEITHIIGLLKTIRDYVSIDGSNVDMSSFNTSKEIVDVINNHIERLSNSDYTKINELILLFLPTSDFQEISISNGWSEAYLKMATEFDSLNKLIKSKKY